MLSDHFNFPSVSLPTFFRFLRHRKLNELAKKYILCLDEMTGPFVFRTTLRNLIFPDLLSGLISVGRKTQDQLCALLIPYFFYSMMCSLDPRKFFILRLINPNIG